MGRLTTHVLDTMQGRPAAGLELTLYRLSEHGASELTTVQLNAEGRTDEPLLTGSSFVAGRYRLVFEVAAYFRRAGVTLPEPPFLDRVPLDFGIAHAQAPYHVPLVMTPWGYSTYRGS